jgi:hypothetical protein
MKLADALTTARCKMSPEAFEHLIRNTFEELYPEFTSEQLFRRPSEGLKYCEAIRKRARTVILPEEIIMGTLENMRKHSKLRTRAESR